MPDRPYGQATKEPPAKARPAPAATPAPPAPAPQVTNPPKAPISNSLADRERAQPAPAKPEPKVNLDLGWLDMEGGGLQRNDQIAAFARLVASQLETDLEDVDSDTVKERAAEWSRTIKASLPYFDRHASEPIDPAMVPLINHRLDELGAIRTAIQQDKVGRLREALWREHRAAEKAAEDAEALQPTLDAALRVAFRKSDSSGIKAVKDAVGAVKSALSVGRNLRSLAADITTDIAGLPVPKGNVMTIDRWSSQLGRVKVTIANVSRYTNMLQTLGRGLSAINIVLTNIDRKKRATDVEQGMKDLNDVVNISTDLASLAPVSLPPHMTLMTTLWIKPALKVIGKQIGHLVENLSEVNQASVEVTGDLMYPKAEPGGQEMFDLMVAVMHAPNASQVPAIDSRSRAYLFEHRGKLEAGTETEMLTSGRLWKDLDSEPARRWLFDNRSRVWAMFYGAMKVPTRARH